MAQNINPVFALKPFVATNKITATTTDKSGATTTNIKTLLTAATDGTKVTQLIFKFEGTSTAGTILIWLTDTGGANPVLFDEVLTTAVTSSTTAITQRLVATYADLQLKSGQQVWVGATVVNTNIHCQAITGDFS